MRDIQWGETGEIERGMDQAKALGNIRDGGRFDRLWPLLWLVWLPNLALPLSVLFRGHPTPLRVGLTLTGATIFVAFYLWTAWQNDLSRAFYPASASDGSRRWSWVPIAVLAGLSVVLILSDGPSWLSLLIFSSASAGGRFSLGRAIRVVAALAVLSGVLGFLAHDAVSDLVQATFWTAMAGALVIILSRLRQTNRALRVAREEVARLAVESERLRFARDLHDLLGHGLARIALQSEVVEALVPTAPDQAIATAREIGDAARTALHEVRAAVAGYRQPTLSSELHAAREILAAAGIAYRHDGGEITVPPAVEAVLSWAVREGVTNVIKHSRARTCLIRFVDDGGWGGVEVVDDGAVMGPPAAPIPGRGGSGLPGLGERAAALGGRCEAGPGPEGGFRLSVMVPVEKDSGVAGRAATGSDARVGTVAGGSL